MDRIERFASSLEHHLGPKAVSSDPDRLIPFSTDESGEGPFPPDLVIYPVTPDHVRTALALAADWRVPVTPRGAGTGKSGGALAVAGGAVLSTERMNRILDLDTEDMVAVVEPGVITADLQQAAEQVGLFFPPDPSSRDACTVGGNVAENAGGPRAMKYGVTGRFVLGAEIGLVGGGKMELGGRVIKDVSGYDLVSLMVGSEGTLGVMTRIQFRMLAHPASVGALWAAFPDFDRAGLAVRSLLASGLDLRCLELMDRSSLDLGVQPEKSGLPTGAAALLAELDGWEETIEPRLLEAGRICDKSGASDVSVALDPAALRRIWQGRRGMSDTLKQACPDKISEDITVPVGKVGTMMRHAWDVAERHGLDCAVYGHAGDGNLHVNFLPESHDARLETTRTAIPELMQAALQLGGTLSGEHGIGLSKRAWMHLRHGPAELFAMRRIKAQWDPLGLLNPGKLIP